MSEGGAMKGRRGKSPRPSLPRRGVVNAVHKINFQYVAVVDGHEEMRASVLKTRRRARRPTLEEIMADTEKRFPKTLAYLAK
jgi:hypothetical protein